MVAQAELWEQEEQEQRRGGGDLLPPAKRLNLGSTREEAAGMGEEVEVKEAGVKMEEGEEKEEVRDGGVKMEEGREFEKSGGAEVLAGEGGGAKAGGEAGAVGVAMETSSDTAATSSKSKGSKGGCTKSDGRGAGGRAAAATATAKGLQLFPGDPAFACIKGHVAWPCVVATREEAVRLGVAPGAKGASKVRGATGGAKAKPSAQPCRALSSTHTHTHTCKLT
jgi:hypothetical protein